MMLTGLARFVSSAFSGVLAIFLVLLTGSCSIHEWPDESSPAKLRIDFVFATDLPPFLDVNYETRTDGNPSDEYDFRYKVKFYPQLPGGGYDRNEAADYTLVLTKDDVTSLNFSTTVHLPEGNWQIRCWADYVRQGSKEDLYYITDDFSGILLPEEHSANTDFKDAFLGSAEVSLRRVGSRQEIASATLKMERPLAKFRFIATDLVEFVEKVLRNRSSGSSEQESTKAQDFDPGDYYIRFRYTSYMPFMFNMFTNKPVDSRTGVEFRSEFTPVSLTEVLMGFDYVLVNGAEASVFVQVELYDSKTDERLMLTPSITIPLVRSKVTTVRGDFLNLGTGSEIGLHTEFDDEYTIFI